jgi:hypothetical protein
MILSTIMFNVTRITVTKICPTFLSIRYMTRKGSCLMRGVGGVLRECQVLRERQ